MTVLVPVAHAKWVRRGWSGNEAVGPVDEGLTSFVQNVEKEQLE